MQLPASENTQSPAASPSSWLERGFVAAMLLACAVALAPNQVDPDLWGHIQYAEDAIAAGALHHQATHTFTAVGFRWINHENLSELALAFGYRYLGPQGMLVGKCLLGLLVMGLMIRAARRQGVRMPVVCATMLLVATALTAFWAMRPQLSSFVILALLVAVLDRAFARWQDEHLIDYRWLGLAPLLFLVWTNSHGAFVAGVFLFMAYFGCRSLEALWFLGRQGWRTVGKLWLAMLACLAVTLANPYGWDLHFKLFQKLTRPRPEISEWLPPAPSDPFFLPFVLLACVTLAAWCFTQKRRDWTQIALVALCLWQAATHSRHIALFAILAGFWLPVHVQSFLDKFRRGARAGVELPLNSRSGKAVLAGLGVALVLLVGKLALRLHEFPVEKDSYPVEAVQFMADNELAGKLVVSFNWAQYAIAALAPDVKVAFDGRFRTCYPQEVIDMQFDFLVGDLPGGRFRSSNSGPIDGQRTLEYLEPNLVLVDRRFTHSARVMAEQKDFVLLYQDSLAQVWGRRSQYDDPRSPRYLAANRRHVSEEPQTGSVSFPALPTRRHGAVVGQPHSNPFRQTAHALAEERS